MILEKTERKYYITANSMQGKDLEVESSKQRGFLEGAVIPLWIYLDGNDYKDTIKQKQYHEYMKEEFNPEMVKISGKMVKVGASTKGQLSGEYGIVNKVIDRQNGSIKPNKIQRLERQNTN